MGRDPVRKGELAHTGNIVHELADPMTEHCGDHHEQGEEDAGPGGDVGEEEVVDMNTALGGKNKTQQEDEGKQAECEGGFEWQG